MHVSVYAMNIQYVYAYICIKCIYVDVDVYVYVHIDSSEATSLGVKASSEARPQICLWFWAPGPQRAAVNYTLL